MPSPLNLCSVGLCRARWGWGSQGRAEGPDLSLGTHGMGSKKAGSRSSQKGRIVGVVQSPRSVQRG